MHLIMTMIVMMMMMMMMIVVMTMKVIMKFEWRSDMRLRAAYQ